MPEPLEQDVLSSLAASAAFPFCKGCGHTTVLRKLNDALVALRLRPEHTVLVTDIGCIGLADRVFRDVHTVHTTHGRSTAFATGIALADSVLADRKLKIIVLIGDGGAMIGLQHLVHAAMLNVDVTVLVCNNFVYGMTGGQGSGLTPECFVTSTTPRGNVVPPADLCGILRHSNASFVARTTATDRGLTDTMREAIAAPGFSVVEILELCTEYAVPKNALKGSSLETIAERNGWELGVLARRPERKPYFEMAGIPGETRSRVAGEGRSQPVTRQQTLRHPLGIVIAGSAGEHVQSSASLLCRTALGRGYYATQKNDNPVTQGTGFSLSEIRLSPRPIEYTGIEHPDVLLILSGDGLREAVAGGWFDRADATTLICLDESVVVSGDHPGVKRFPFRKVFGPLSAALGSLLWLCVERRVADSGEFLGELRRSFGEEAAARVSAAYDVFVSGQAGS